LFDHPVMDRRHGGGLAVVVLAAGCAQILGADWGLPRARDLERRRHELDRWRYFEPLSKWLDAENKGEACGW
jgi:hypothetical protein